MKRTDLIIIIPFLIILLAVPVFGVFLPDKPYSLTETRALAQIPIFNSSLKYTSELETYVVEQFPIREHLLKLYTLSELAQHKKSIRNVFITQDNYLLTREYKPDGTLVKGLNTQLTELCKNPSYSFASFYYAILPNKTGSLAALESDYIPTVAEEGGADTLVQALTSVPKLNVINVHDYFQQSLSLEQRAKLYFKSDFHWNARGAYYAADYIQNQLSADNLLSENERFTSSDFLWSTIAEDTLFQGDLNVRFSNYFSQKEDVPIFAPAKISDTLYYLSPDNTKNVLRSEIISSGLGKPAVGYNDIYTHNLGYYRIENKGAKTDKSILVLKDSLQNPTTELFSTIFQTVEVIDPRAYKENPTLNELLLSRKPDIVLFMFHHSNASAELISFLQNK